MEHTSAHLLLGSALLLLLLLLGSSVFYLFKQRDQRPETANNFTVLKSYPIVGNLPHLVKNRARLLDWVAELIPGSPTGTVTVAPVVFTANPSNVEHTTKTRFDAYHKGPTNTATLHDFLGDGIFNTNGEKWRVQRKTASYEFNTKSLRAFVLETVRREVVGRLVPLLARAGRTGDVLDLQDILERFAFDNICSLLFDEDPNCLVGGGSEAGERFYHAFEEATNLIIYRWNYPFHWMWKIMRWLNAGSERRLKDSLVTVHEYVGGLVRSRRRVGGAAPLTSGGSDFLSRFAEDAGHSEEFLRDILISFLIAGRDTTPSALTWFFWVASSRPDVVGRILEELGSIRSRRESGGGDEVFTLDELREMHYLQAAISESLRLYPPVPLLPRTCREDDVLPDGTVVPRGWTVMYSSYVMGRSESVWGEDCAEFRPERWLDGGVFQPASQFRFPVFHGGPQMCLGKEMAYIQMKAVAASILEGFEIEVAEERGKHQLSMTMRMDGGLPVRVKERKPVASKVSDGMSLST